MFSTYKIGSNIHHCHFASWFNIKRWLFTLCVFICCIYNMFSYAKQIFNKDFSFFFYIIGLW